MALPDLTGQNIEETYPRLLHTDSGLIYDGTGSLVDVISATASFAVSASYAISASYEIVKEVSSSFADTASYVNPLNQDVIINGDLNVTGSVIASGSSFTFIGPVFAEDVTLTGSFAGFFSGSADLPDLTNSTGVTAFTYDGSSPATVQVSGSDGLNSNTVTKWSGDAFNNTNITDNGTAVAINSDTFITGSLTVSGSNSTINTQELQFDTDHIKTGHSTGRMFWDDDNKTVTLDMQGSDVRLQLGQEEHVYAKNTSGVAINNGDAVRISGAVGANVTIEKAISSIKSFKDTIEQDQILGVATEQIPDNQSGYVTTFGAVRDLNTSAFNEGDILYLSNTTSGSYSSIRPTAPFFEARVGVVQVSNPTEGVVLVRPQEPIFFTDISQVTASGVVVGGKSYLCYDDNTEIIGFTNSFTGSFSGSFEGTLGPISNTTYRLTSSFYTASVSDYRIGVRYTQTGSVSIQLPLIANAGEIEYKFKDEEGNAKQQNITIIASGSDLIDGDRNAILDRNYIAIGIYNDGTSNWFIE